MANNIYGVQKVKEPEVRDGMDIGTSVASATAQGVQAGSALGPWGMVGAGLGFGAMSLMNQQAMQAEEKRALKNAEAHNKGATALEGRGLRTNNYVSAQAKHGMNSNNKYKDAEIEGDGSQSPDGIGEIHVDKNYNIKNIAKGARKHENGGYKINNLQKNDIIFPTQNSTKDYNDIMGAIKRYKLNGDKRAKKFLDGKAAALPTDEDYGYARNGGRYEDGKGKKLSPKDELRKAKNDGKLDLTNRQIRTMSDKEVEKYKKKLQKMTLKELDDLDYKPKKNIQEGDTATNPQFTYEELYGEEDPESTSQETENYIDEEYNYDELYGEDAITPEYPDGKGKAKAKRKKLSKKDFYAKYYPIIKKAIKDTGSKILPQTAMSQFVMENGYLEFTKDSTAFGKKAYGGKGKKMVTSEVVQDENGNNVLKRGLTSESFVTSESFEDAVKQYLDIFKNTKNKNYILANKATTPEAQIKAIADGGYATLNKAHTNSKGVKVPYGEYERRVKKILKYNTDASNKIDDEDNFKAFVEKNKQLIEDNNIDKAQQVDLYSKDVEGYSGYSGYTPGSIDPGEVIENYVDEDLSYDELFGGKDGSDLPPPEGPTGVSPDMSKNYGTTYGGFPTGDLQSNFNERNAATVNDGFLNPGDRDYDEALRRFKEAKALDPSNKTYDLEDLPENPEEEFVDNNPTQIDNNPTQNSVRPNPAAIAQSAFGIPPANYSLQDQILSKTNTAQTGGSPYSAFTREPYDLDGSSDMKDSTQDPTQTTSNVANDPNNQFQTIDIDPVKKAIISKRKQESLPAKDKEFIAKQEADRKRRKRDFNKAARRKRNDELWEEINTIENYDNPLKYSSMINKGIQGSKSIDRVERRFMTPEEDKYVDTSAKQRQNIIENRNYQSNKLDGKGLSAGQQQSYNRQIGSKYISDNEQIENTEFSKRNAIEKGNVAKRNTAQEGNIKRANQYDTFDDMATGKKQEYKDQMYSDMSQLALNNEKQRRAEARNRKQYLVQQATINSMGTKDYEYEDNPLQGSRYKK